MLEKKMLAISISPFPVMSLSFTKQISNYQSHLFGRLQMLSVFGQSKVSQFRKEFTTLRKGPSEKHCGIGRIW